MKLLVILMLVAAAWAEPGYLGAGYAGVAGYAGYAGHLAAPAIAGPAYVGPAYAGPINIPVVNPAGFLEDTADVKVAKAAHFSAHVDANARHGFVAGAVLGGPAYAAGPLAGHAVYGGPIHLPVINPAGYVEDTPDVKIARAAHVTAHHDAKLRHGIIPGRKKRSPGYLGAPLAGAYAGAPLAAAAYAGAPVVGPAYAGPAYAGPINIPVVNPAGYLEDTADVKVAKAAHFSAHVDANARHGFVAGAVLAGPAYAAGPLAGHAVYGGPIHLPVVNPAGFIEDTPETQVLKAAHASAHHDAKVRNGVVFGRKKRSPGYLGAPLAGAYAGAHLAGAYAGAPLAAAAYTGAPVVGPAYAGPAYAGPINIPVVNPAGYLEDTADVKVARAAHISAHVDANARHGLVAGAVFGGHAYAAGPLAAPAVYGGPIHLPVVNPAGFIEDTPDVKVLRSAHAAAHHDAKVRNGVFFG